jgi:hypothetical protein
VGISQIVVVYLNNLALIIAWICVSLCLGLIETFHPMIRDYPDTRLYVSQKFSGRLLPLFVTIALIINTLIQEENLYFINIIAYGFIVIGSFYGTKYLVDGLGVIKLKNWGFVYNYSLVFLTLLIAISLFARVAYFVNQINLFFWIGALILISVEYFFAQEIIKEIKNNTAIPFFFTSIGVLLGILLIILTFFLNNIERSFTELICLVAHTPMIFSIIILSYPKLKDSLQEIKGTSYRWANLTSANFTNANLTNCDFFGANLTDVDFTNLKIKNCRFD